MLKEMRGTFRLQQTMDCIRCGMRRSSSKWSIPIWHCCALAWRMPTIREAIRSLDRRCCRSIRVEQVACECLDNGERVRAGYRSVPLCNTYSEPLELSALLVHMKKDTKGAGGCIIANSGQLHVCRIKCKTPFSAHRQYIPIAQLDCLVDQFAKI